MDRLLGIKDRKGKPIKETDVLLIGENLKAKIVWIGENVDEYGDEIHCAYHLKIINGSNLGKLIPIDSWALQNCIIE